MTRLMTVLGLCWVFALGGCSSQRVGGVVAAAGAQYQSEGSVRNTLTVNPDRSTVQDYTAEPPAATIVSGQGIEHYGAVPPNALGISLPDGTILTSATPGDFRADSLKITRADGSVVDMAGVSVNTSDVIVARATFVTQMAPIIGQMTQAQKDALLAQYEAQAALGDTFAKSVLPFVQALVTGG